MLHATVKGHQRQRARGSSLSLPGLKLSEQQGPSITDWALPGAPDSGSGCVGEKVCFEKSAESWPGYVDSVTATD